MGKDLVNKDALTVSGPSYWVPVTFPSLSFQNREVRAWLQYRGRFWKGYRSSTTAWCPVFPPAARLPSPAPASAPDAALPPISHLGLCPLAL